MITKCKALAKTEHERRNVSAYGLDPEEVEAMCFECCYPVRHPAIVRLGGRKAANIYLHRKCAAHLARELARDVNDPKSVEIAEAP